MKNKRWLRSVVFLVLLAVAVTGVMQCYGLPKSYDTRNLAALDAEGENLIDGIILGTSVVGYSWITPAVWQDYGFAIYHMATSVQPFGIIPEYIDYVRKKQDIKYVVVDVHGLRKDTVMASLQSGKFRSAYLNIPDITSQAKILCALFDYAEAAYDFYGEPKENRGKYVNLKDKSYYLPILNFHSRWVDGLKKADYVTVANKYMGANDRSNAFGVMDCSKYVKNWKFDSPEDIDSFQKKQLERIFNYGKENDIELIFISLPSFRSKEEQREMAGILKYCSEQGYDTLDFADEKIIEEAGIDVSEDFLNKGHLNSRGGVKSTKYICEFLIKKGYYTPDHRGEKGYENWDKATAAYWKFYNKGWQGKG